MLKHGCLIIAKRLKKLMFLNDIDFYNIPEPKEKPKLIKKEEFESLKEKYVEKKAYIGELESGKIYKWFKSKLNSEFWDKYKTYNSCQGDILFNDPYHNSNGSKEVLYAERIAKDFEKGFLVLEAWKQKKDFIIIKILYDNQVCWTYISEKFIKYELLKFE